MNKILIIVISIFTAGVSCAQQQPVSIDTIAGKFREYRTRALQEKLYAHIDRTFYLTGETLWFKIYSVDGTLHRPLDLSTVAYAEVLDRGNVAVLQAKVGLDNGQGHGSFFLPASLMSGNYKLRIYTSWMKNFSAEFFYDRVFTLVNPFVTPEASAKAPVGGYTVDLFPEGGNLVAGIKSKVGFRILDQRGMGANIRGWLVNHKNDTVASLAPHNFGIGHFFLTPTMADRYRVVLDRRHSVAGSFVFPAIHPAGYVMQIADSAESVLVTVQALGVAGDIYLFAHARQSIVHAEAKAIHSKVTFDIPKRKIHEGITHLTLFNSRGEPVCERLYFTLPRKELDIALGTPQQVYSPRSKVSVALNSTVAGEGAPAKLSMSVYKVDSLEQLDGTHIYPYLWLASDLTGRVESPEYYFRSGDASSRIAIDNLMLTHGWRRFHWGEVFSGQSFRQYLPEVRDHIVKVAVNSAGEHKRGVFTYLASPGKSIRAYGAWTDNNGEVKFEIKDLHGPRRIILQARDTADAHTLSLQDPFSSAKDKEKLIPLELKPATAESILSRSIAMQVQHIFSGGDSAIAPSGVVDTTAFYGKADATYHLDDYTRFPVMEEVMREYVPEVFVRKRKDGFHFIVAEAHAGVLPGDPMVLVDGLPVLDVDDVMQMDPLRVQKLEIVRHMYYLGQASFPGVVSYTTYRGDLGGMELNPQSLSLNYEGLQLKREFFKPTYSRESEDSRMPDQRYLLHWEPDIQTDQRGSAVVEFFTSDVPGRYRVVVEGVNDKGYAGSKIYEFTVSGPGSQ